MTATPVADFRAACDLRLQIRAAQATLARRSAEVIAARLRNDPTHRIAALEAARCATDARLARLRARLT